MRIEKIQTLEQRLCELFQPDSFIFRALTSNIRLKDITGVEFQEVIIDKRVHISYTKTSFLILALIKTVGVAKEVCISRGVPGLNHYNEGLSFDVFLSESSALTTAKMRSRTRISALDTNVLIYTSGTTAAPKLVSRSFGSLTDSVKKNVKNSKVVWGLCYDPQKFAGLQVLLQALLSGSTICGIQDYSRPDFTSLIESFISSDCTAISATPSFWRVLLGFNGVSKLKLDFITMGGEIVSQDILDKARRAFPQARITHIYASTEVGVGFSVRDCKEGFPAEYLDSSELTSKLKIIDGELYIKSTRVGTYINSLNKMVDVDGYVPTGDLVKLDDSTSRVLFVGRRNKSMNIGGNKVMPEEIERVVESVGYIKICRAYSIPHSLLGNVVALEFVKDPDCPLSLPELKRNIILECKNKLERHKIPVKIYEVASVKLSGSGKVVRQ